MYVYVYICIYSNIYYRDFQYNNTLNIKYILIFTIITNSNMYNRIEYILFHNEFTLFITIYYISVMLQNIISHNK